MQARHCVYSTYQSAIMSPYAIHFNRIAPITLCAGLVTVRTAGLLLFVPYAGSNAKGTHFSRRLSWALESYDGGCSFDRRRILSRWFQFIRTECSCAGSLLILAEPAHMLVNLLPTFSFSFFLCNRFLDYAF